VALLDVSEVLSDPDFVDYDLVCKRQNQVIGANGRAVNTPESLPFSGVVTSYSGDLLERIEIGDRIKGSIMIHTTFVLRESGPGISADIVTWKGRDYTVKNVDDYSHFGAGFIGAMCELIPLEG